MTRTLRRILAASGAVLLLGVAGYTAWVNWQDHQATAAFLQAAQSGKEAAREGTDERAVTDRQQADYVVAPDLPRYLTISKIGVHARVLRLGLNDTGAIAAPRGIWDVGWYEGSAKPSEAGTVFIDGHISGPTLPAVFMRLHELVPGDIIAIERGSGELLRYQVQNVETKKLGEIDMASILGSHNGNAQSLVLMTCIGQFDSKKYAYDSRLTVVAKRI